MSPTARRRMLLSIALAGVAPVALPAQTVTHPREPVRIIASIGNARADTLEARATAMLRNTSRWAEAARLQRRAAELRGDDPRAVESFTRAAWMYGGARRLTPARQMMERAASRAAAGGDVERAAGAWLDAALIAVEAKREDLVPSLIRRTRRMVQSPLLPADRRAIILQRIDGAPVLARHWHAADER